MYLCVRGTWGLKEGIDPLDELVVSHHVATGNKIQVLCKSSQSVLLISGLLSSPNL